MPTSSLGSLPWTAVVRPLQSRKRQIEDLSGFGHLSRAWFLSHAMESRFAIAGHVRSIWDGDGAVLLDLHSGKYLALNPVGSLVWQGVAAGDSLDAIVGRLAGLFIVPAERLRQDAEALLVQLLARGLVCPRASDGASGAGLAAGAPRAGVPEVGPAGASPPAPSAFPRVSRVSVVWCVVAYIGLITVDTSIKLLGFRTFYAALRRWPVWPWWRRDRAPVGRIAASVDRAAAFYFKRAWCLERSAVTVLLLRLRGLPARLVFGAHRLPFSAHAWVELAGEVINDHPAVRRSFQVLETC